MNDIKQYFKMHEIEFTEMNGRIIDKKNYLYTVRTSDGEVLQMKTVNNLSTQDIFVGDFVEFIDYEAGGYLIVKVLPRVSSVSKQTSHASKSFYTVEGEQILAANVDQIFILIAADQRFTLPKFERYVLTFNRENISLHVLISKGDYSDRAEEIRSRILSVYPDFEITVFSNFQKNTVETVKTLFQKDGTAILIGSSGAGKSTLLNQLLESDEILTNEVRRDGKGRHTTTTTRMLYVGSVNAYIIDSPGFKTISTTNQMDEDVLFGDIKRLADGCKFNDCTHVHEPGCRVLNAVDTGEITEAYYKRYLENRRIVNGQMRHEARKKRMR